MKGFREAGELCFGQARPSWENMGYIEAAGGSYSKIGKESVLRFRVPSLGI